MENDLGDFGSESITSGRGQGFQGLDFELSSFSLVLLGPLCPSKRPQRRDVFALLRWQKFKGVDTTIGMHQCNFDPREHRWPWCPRQPVCNRLLPCSWRSGMCNCQCCAPRFPPMQVSRSDLASLYAAASAPVNATQRGERSGARVHWLASGGFSETRGWDAPVSRWKMCKRNRAMALDQVNFRDGPTSNTHDVKRNAGLPPFASEGTQCWTEGGGQSPGRLKVSHFTELRPVKFPVSICQFCSAVRAVACGQISDGAPIR